MTDPITTRAIIKAIGASRLAELFGCTTNAVYNWSEMGHFPAHTYIQIKKELQKKKLTAPDSLWKMRKPPGRRRTPEVRA